MDIWNIIPILVIFFWGGGTPGSRFFRFEHDFQNHVVRLLFMLLDIFITAVILGFEEERWG